jgi:hypothetical protein
VHGYVVAKGRRFYAAIYEGIDPFTGQSVDWQRKARTDDLARCGE